MLKAAKRDFFRASIRKNREFDFEVKSFKLQFYEPTYFWGYSERKEAG